MSDDEKNHKQKIYVRGKFVASEESLAIAEDLADAMGKKFDAKKAQKVAGQFHELIFQEILDSLNLSDDKLRLIEGSVRQTTTFIAKNGKDHEIILDDEFGFWVWGMTHYLCIFAFYPLEDEEFEELYQDWHKMMLLRSEAHLFGSVRAGFLKYLKRHTKCVYFSHRLSKAILSFIMCHEIAHSQLDHLEQKQSKEMELEADLHATEYFVELIEANKSETAVFNLLDNHYAAPLIATDILDLHEYWLTLNGSNPADNNSHPSAQERKKHIEGIITPALNIKSAETYHDFQDVFADIKRFFKHYCYG